MKRTDIKKFPMQDSTLKGLEPEEKEYRVNDNDNLHFVVKPNGRKRWELRYKKPSNGVWSWLGLGSFDHVGGMLARQRAEEARMDNRSVIDQLISI